MASSTSFYVAPGMRTHVPEYREIIFERQVGSRTVKGTLRYDRNKVMYFVWVAILVSFAFVHGLFDGDFSFYSLRFYQDLTGSTSNFLTRASGFLSARWLGNIAGGFMWPMLSSRADKLCLIGLCLVVLSGLLVAFGVCVDYTVLVVLCSLTGFFYAGIETLSFALIRYWWTGRLLMVFQVLLDFFHLSGKALSSQVRRMYIALASGYVWVNVNISENTNYSFASTTLPVVGDFLTQFPKTSTTAFEVEQTKSSNFSATSAYALQNASANVTSTYALEFQISTTSVVTETFTVLAFWISRRKSAIDMTWFFVSMGGMLFVFFLMYCCPCYGRWRKLVFTGSDNDGTVRPASKEASVASRRNLVLSDLGRKFLIGTLLTLSFFYVGIEVSLPLYLLSFQRQRLNLSDDEMGIYMSIFWSVFILGRLIGNVMTRFLSIDNVLLLNFILADALWLTCSFFIHSYSSCLGVRYLTSIAVAMGSVFPCLIVWCSRCSRFVYSAKYALLIQLTCVCGGFAYAVMVAQLMEKNGDEYFLYCYVFSFVVCTIVLIVWRIVAQFVYTENVNSSVVVSADIEQEGIDSVEEEEEEEEEEAKV